MSLPVHWCAELADARVGATVVLEGDEAHHAVAVRRLAEGEALCLVDGRGRRVTGVVAATGKRRLTLEVERVDDEPRPLPSLTVVQALPKGDRGELAVEVLTEIGVERIVPWAAERSVAVWRGERAAKSLAKWRSTALQAGKQARRSWMPEVTSLASTAEAVRVVGEADVALVLHEAASRPIATTLSRLPATASIALVVGPEGGLSDAEVAAFAEAGAQSVRLGAEVLRTSTAGLAAAAAVLAGTPRWA